MDKDIFLFSPKITNSGFSLSPKFSLTPLREKKDNNKIFIYKIGRKK